MACEVIGVLASRAGLKWSGPRQVGFDAVADLSKARSWVPDVSMFFCLPQMVWITAG